MNAIEIYKQNKIEKMNVIDIRSEIKFNHFHIPGAINVDPGQLFGEPEKFIKKDEEWHIVCNSGNSSQMVVMMLKQNGYNVHSVDEGMNQLLRVVAN